MATPTTPSIAVIICSTRQPRVCPQIASFITTSLLTSPTSEFSNPTPPASLTLLDLSTWNLPMFNEPTIPSQIKNPQDYQQPHTRAWSEEISKHQAFIFVLPQYNWGYPAVLKNAIDYLFHEWVGKPAMIVSYGGHGGGKAAEQLKQVLMGVRMRVVETMPGLSFPGRKELVAATKGEEMDLSGWDGEKEGIVRAGEELLNLLTGEELGKAGEKGT